MLERIIVFVDNVNDLLKSCTEILEGTQEIADAVHKMRSRS